METFHPAPCVAFLRHLRSTPRSHWPRLLQDYTAGAFAAEVHHLLRDPDALTAVAGRSYVHGNGFTKVVLAADDGLVLRLHVAGGAAEDNVHDHRWPFASVILAGGLDNVLYSPAEGGEALRRFRYARGADGESRAEPAGTASVREIGRQSLRAGQAYRLEPHQMHRIRWQAGCRTLVVTGPPVAESCQLLSLHPSPAVRPTPLRAEDVRRALEAA